MAESLKRVDGAPAWAVSWLRRAGYSPRACMDDQIRQWWLWYQAASPFYRPAGRGVGDAGGCEFRHLTLCPARMACDEWAAITMDDKTSASSPDAGFDEWLRPRFKGFVASERHHVALAFALGTAAYVANWDPAAGGFELDFVDAGGIIPLRTERGESVSCAFATDVDVCGRRMRQLQVHEPDRETGLYSISTLFFEPGREDAGPVACEEVEPLVETRSPYPTYALLRPDRANTYHDGTPMGVSVFDDAVDAIMGVDEAYDSFFWAMRLCQPRLVVDEDAIVRGPDGEALVSETVDARLYRALRGGVDGRVPITVYNPQLYMDEREAALNDALSILSAKLGMGPNYWSFSRQAGLRTATEVVADNSALQRSLRGHEAQVGRALERAFAGAYAAGLGVSGRAVPDGLSCDVQWDDSVAEDTGTERATMKDDVARGLCPAWMYLARYYGMGEAEARAFTGEPPSALCLPDDADE